jgi:hypothetical protein
MNSITADIKNLSIALEALSRFPGTESLSSRLRQELDKFIQELIRRRHQHERILRQKSNSTDDDYND